MLAAALFFTAIGAAIGYPINGWEGSFIGAFMGLSFWMTLE